MIGLFRLFCAALVISHVAPIAAAQDVLTDTERGLIERLGVRSIVEASDWPGDETVIAILTGPFRSYAKDVWRCESSELTGIAEPRLAILDRVIERNIDTKRAQTGWFAFAKGNVCDKAVQVKTLLYKKNDGGYWPIFMVAGETHVWLALMIDSRRSVEGAISLENLRSSADCSKNSSFSIVDTRVIDDSQLAEQIYGFRMSGSWTEEWIVHSCGVEMTIDATFTADGRGGASFNFLPRDGATKPLEK